MPPFLWQRRKFLAYMGLGAIAAADSQLFGWQSAIVATPLSPSQPISAKMIAANSLGRLPEFQGISEWINSPPLTTSELRDRVVLVQIWTLGCINCQRTLPYVVDWHRKYAAKGLQTIGVHTPEFPFERDSRNIRRAMKRHGITYPVAVDNNFEMWKAYHNQYWPHLFLADRQGIIRYDHIGEGAYAETEQMIRQLLG